MKRKRATRRGDYSSLAAFMTSKKSLIVIVDDALREARAVAVARCYKVTHAGTSKADVAARQRIRDNRQKHQKSQADVLMQDMQSGSDSLSIFKALQRKLGEDYRFELYTETGRSPEHVLGEVTAQHCLQFLLCGVRQRATVGVITNICALTTRGFRCRDCGTLVGRRRDHSCQVIGAAFCNVCKRVECRKRAVGQYAAKQVQCDKCRTWCFNEACRAAHKCRFRVCVDCELRYSLVVKRPNDGAHVCREFLCPSCRLMCPPDHTCFVKRLSDADIGYVSGNKCANTAIRCGSEEEVEEGSEEETGSSASRGAVDVDADENVASLSVGERCQYIFFDIETGCDENDVHQPYLIMAMHADGTTYKFDGDNCLQDFCEWAFSLEFRNYRFFAHNASGYDSFFLLYFLRASYHRVEPTITGGRILEIKLPDLKISVIDFFLFCPTALSKLPKMLALNVELKKDFFPHLCFSKENRPLFTHYRGVLPEKELFDIRQCHGQRFIDFEKWYDERKASGEVYDIDAEAVTYCTQDCQILRLSVLKFRFIFLQLSDGKFDATRVSISMPQSSMQLFRFVNTFTGDSQ